MSKILKKSVAHSSIENIFGFFSHMENTTLAETVPCCLFQKPSESPYPDGHQS